MNNNVTGSSPDPLLNASLTTGSGLGPTTESTTAPQTPIPSATPKKTEDVAPSEFQLFEGIDSFDSGKVVVQQFIAEQRWGKKDYQADPRQPVLNMPDPDGATGPQPFEPSWQKAANKFFREQIKEVLVNKLKEKESGGSPAFAQELLQKFQSSGESVAYLQEFIQSNSGKETSTGEKKESPIVAKETIKKESVSSKQEGMSKPESAPALPQPLVLTALVNVIVQAAVTGKVADLSKDGQEIVAKATEQTQKTWSLPAFWTFGTQQIKDWTPITTNVTAPTNAVNMASKEMLAQNTEKLCVSLNSIGQKMMADLPSNDPKRIAVGDLIRTIANAIRDLKVILQELQLIESDASSKSGKAHLETIQDRDKIITENAKKIDEAAEARAKQAKMSKIMKIVAPIVAAIVLVVSIIALIATPFTGGLSLALAIAGVAVASAMLAYTVADSAFDVTSKIMGAFNALMQKIEPTWARNLVKALILIAVVIILVVAIAASGGSAAGSIATQVAAQVAKQITIQLAIMFIMSSNILPELVVETLIKTGAINENDEHAKMIVQMVVMAFTMVATLGMAAKGQGALRSIGNTISEGAQVVGRAVKDIATAANKLVTIAIAQGLRAAIAELQVMIANLTRMLGQLIKQGINQAGTAIEGAINKVTAAAKEFNAALTRAGGTIKTSFTSAKESVIAAAERFLETLKNLDQVLANAAKKISEVNLQQLKDIGKSTAKSLETFGAGLKELDPRPNFKQLLMGAVEIFDIRSLGDLGKKLTLNKFYDAKIEIHPEEFRKAAQQAQDLFKMAGLGVEVGGSIYIGVIGLKLVDILKQMGELEKAKEVADLLIKLFQKMIDSFQEGLSARSEWINGLDQALSSVYGAGSQMSTKATQQALA